MSSLRVRNLTVRFGSACVVDDISFDVEPGEILGIVGQSGSGKTMTALALCRLLPPTAEISGTVIFEGKDLLRLSESQMRKLRGKKIAMIFQDPSSSLNPVTSVGEQISEMLRLHRKDVRGSERRSVVRGLLRKVGFPEPERSYKSFPYELSGGMNQRVVIAIMALATKPAVLIADEPTTALDVILQARLLDMISSFVKEEKIATLFITHNFGLTAEYADKVMVMRAGKIVEVGSVFDVFSNPQHPYTKELLDVVPKLHGGRHNA